MTEEEKKERKKISNKKYFEAHKNTTKFKESKRASDKKYRESNEEKYKAAKSANNKRLYYNDKSKKIIYQKLNKEKIAADKKIYFQENKKSFSERAKKYYAANKEKGIKPKNRKFLNPKDLEKRRIRENKFVREKRLKNPLFRLTTDIRSIIGKALRRNGYKKTSKTNKILGCSFEDFKLYLESKFESWMNWNNRGLYNGDLNYGWDIDHIIPLAAAKTEDEIIKLNHYTNLQPLCSKYNRDIKKNK